MNLRDYQEDILKQVSAGSTNDLVQLDTGAGKTPIEAALAETAERVILVAHRNILIKQISEKLAAFGIYHDTISTEHTRRQCMAAHRRMGESFIQRGNTVRLVASIQSIASAVRHGRFNLDTSAEWLIIIDEAHHALPDNMWGLLRDLFPKGRIVGFTATPARMDGESLHVDNGGLFERLVQSGLLGDNSTKELMDRGHLSAYSVFAPTSPPMVAGEEREFILAGDPVSEYRNKAAGTQAILMAPSIKNAEEFAQQFRSAGIPSACINSTQSPAEISRILSFFDQGRIKVLANVDMVGEGFDLPACETLIIATRTMSFPRYRQWCGRILRPALEKERGIIIDLTGMCAQHGLPDDPVKWDLKDPPVGPKFRHHVPCDSCGLFFPVREYACPECGWRNEWLDRAPGFSPGTYHFDIKVLGLALVETVRRERYTKSREAMLQSELLPPPAPEFFGRHAIGRAVWKIAEWFPKALRDSGVPVREINRFLESPKALSSEFYIDNFTVADARPGSTEKAVRVYKKWLKSQ